jgi:hypothetical protein
MKNGIILGYQGQVYLGEMLTKISTPTNIMGSRGYSAILFIVRCHFGRHSRDINFAEAGNEIHLYVDLNPTQFKRC